MQSVKSEYSQVLVSRRYLVSVSAGLSNSSIGIGAILRVVYVFGPNPKYLGGVPKYRTAARRGVLRSTESGRA